MSKKQSKHVLLLKTMKKLRGPNGCPWDKLQTHESLIPCLIEEAYEVIDAIEQQNIEKLKEELGDLFLQILFHSQIAEENNNFNLETIYEDLHKKLIYRHPHVFSRSKKFKAKDVHGALKHWQKQKAAEHKLSSSILDHVTPSMPALKRAQKIQQKASTVGFDWKSLRGVIAKIEEEIAELSTAMKRRKKMEIKHELGDVLFSIVNLARFNHIDAEDALRQTNIKFVKRFMFMEKMLDFDKKKMDKMSLKQWNRLWEKAKKNYLPNI